MSVKIQKITVCPGGHILTVTALVKGEKKKKQIEVRLDDKRKFQEIAEKEFAKQRKQKVK